MTTLSFPFEGQPTSGDQYRLIFDQLQDPGVFADAANGSASLVPSLSGLTVRIGAGSAFIRGHVFTSDADTILTPDALDSGQSQRFDLAVLRLDPSDKSMSLALVKGDAAGYPVATQDPTGIYELIIGRVQVGTSGATAVIDIRTWVSRRFGFWTTSTRPGIASAMGTIGFNVTTNCIEVLASDGSLNPNNTQWRSIDPIDTGWTDLAIVSGFKAGGLTTSDGPQYRMKGGVVYFRGFVQPNSGSFGAQATIPICPAGSLPTEARPAVPVLNQGAGSAAGSDVRIAALADGSIQIWTSSSPPAYVSLASITPYPV